MAGDIQRINQIVKVINYRCCESSSKEDKCYTIHFKNDGKLIKLKNNYKFDTHNLCKRKILLKYIPYIIYFFSK